MRPRERAPPPVLDENRGELPSFRRGGIVVTITDVAELLEGRGLRPFEEEMEMTVFNVVLERFMEARRIDTYDDLHAMFTEAGYEMDYEMFLDACYGVNDAMTIPFVRGVIDVLELEPEEAKAFAWAHLWGTE
jgi:hypothetical protein